MRLSTGRVTLNMSMVLTMIAGVVRKKRRMNRQMLSRTNRTHHKAPRTDRFSLQERKDMHEVVCWEGLNLLVGWKDLSSKQYPVLLP